MIQLFPIVMLPTEKASKIGIRDSGELTYCSKNFVSGLNHHLYIISDDEIKEGDWYIYFDLQGVPLFPLKYDEKNQPDDLDKKIVATTDESLEWIRKHTDYKVLQLPQLPESFMPEYIKAYNEDKPITKVGLEMEIERKLDHMVDMGDPSTWCKYITTRKIKINKDNTVIILGI